MLHRIRSWRRIRHSMPSRRVKTAAAGRKWGTRRPPLGRFERRYEPEMPKGVPGRNGNNTLIGQWPGGAPSIGIEYGTRKARGWIPNDMTTREGPAFQAGHDDTGGDVRAPPPAATAQEPRCVPGT